MLRIHVHELETRQVLSSDPPALFFNKLGFNFSQDSTREDNIPDKEMIKWKAGHLNETVNKQAGFDVAWYGGYNYWFSIFKDLEIESHPKIVIFLLFHVLLW